MRSACSQGSFCTPPLLPTRHSAHLHQYTHPCNQDSCGSPLTHKRLSSEDCSILGLTTLAGLQRHHCGSSIALVQGGTHDGPLKDRRTASAHLGICAGHCNLQEAAAKALHSCI